MKRWFWKLRMIDFLFGLGGLALTASCAMRGDAEFLRPDTILFNGKIVTVDKNFSIAQGVSQAELTSHNHACGISDRQEYRSDEALRDHG